MPPHIPRRRPAIAVGLAGVLAVRLAGCVATGGVLAPPVTPELLAASPAPVGLEQLNTGRAIYVDRCSACHNLYRPDRYDAKGWVKILPDMSRRAELSAEEAELVEAYLLTASAYSRAPASDDAR